jgi:hypothetical protein
MQKHPNIKIIPHALKHIHQTRSPHFVINKNRGKTLHDA